MLRWFRTLRSQSALRAATALLAALGVPAVLAPQALASGNVNWAAGVQAQLPADAGTSGQLGLVTAISCPSSGDCTAVGQYNDALDHAQGLLLSQTSAVWGTGVAAALPADAAADPGVTLSSVSCTSAGNCTAVGSYTGGSGGTEGLLLTETAGLWAAGVEASLPADAGPTPSVDLNSVSCSSPGNCIAVGNYKDVSSRGQGVLLTQVDGTWSPPVEAPLPNDASASPGVSLNSVSCTSVGNCTAVGNFNDGSGVEGLLLTETAGSWATGAQATLPNDSNALPNVVLQSVSCSSPGDCAAVGNYLDGSFNYQGLLLTQSAGTWASGTRAPLPANAPQSPVVSLPSVSCTSAGDCTAVGNYYSGSSPSHGLMLTETGGNWGSAVEATPPANASSSPNVLLPSVSCASSGNCGAVGEYQDSAGNFQGLLLTESGNTWATGVEAGLPAGSATNPNVVLNSVSCDSADSCSTVGHYEDASTSFQGVIISASPTTPTLSVSSPAAAIASSSIPSSSVAANLGGGANPTGTITFTVFGPQSMAPSSCTSGGTTVGTASLSGNGSYNPSAAFTPPSTGTYWWYASYGGDAGNSPITSTCGAGMPSTLVRQATTTLTVSAPAQDTDGVGVHPDALLSGSTSGSGGAITFTVFGPQASPPSSCSSGGTTVGTDATVSGDGQYNPNADFTPGAAGTYWWYASYSGDPNDASSASTCGAGMTSTVVTHTTTLTGGWPQSDVVGTAITPDSLSAILLGAGPGAGGTVSFTVFGPQSSPPSTCTSGGTSLGSATVSSNTAAYNPTSGFTPTAAGTYWWYASYSGDAENQPSSTPCGTALAVMSVAPVSTVLNAGAPSTGTVDSPVAASSISATLSQAAGGAGGTITFTVFGPRSSAPSSCTSGGATVDTVPVSGSGTYSPLSGFTPSAGGTYWWYASYGGDSNDAGSTSTCGAGMASMAVSKLTPSLSAAAPSSGSVGSAIAAGSITGLLSGTANGAGGTVAFTVVGPQSTAPSSCAGAGKPAGSAVVSGDGTYHPSFAFTPTAPGRYWWFATYGGDAGDASTTSACGASMASTVVVLPRPTLGNLKQTHTKWQPGSKMPSIFRSTSVTPVGTTFTFTLNEPATVKLVFTHVVNRRTLTAGTLSLPGHLGSDRILFQGRLSATKKLAPGTYTVAFTATNTAHQSTAPQKLTFTIV